MIYLYRSTEGHEIEIIRYPSKQKIPSKISRKKVVYFRVFTSPDVIIDANQPKTLGSLAEKNTNKMVKEGKIKPKETKIPWWRKSKKVNQNLAKMSSTKLKRYIKTGQL